MKRESKWTSSVKLKCTLLMWFMFLYKSLPACHLLTAFADSITVCLIESLCISYLGLPGHGGTA